LVWGILIVCLAIALLIGHRFSAPEFPPLPTRPDDPLLLAARDKARASLGQFRDLLLKYPKNGIIKLRFVSNSDQVEYLWAEVLEAREAEYKVRLITPPVTHTGTLERLYVCKEEDIDDWQVTDADGNPYGAFSQRAMFEIARRDGVTLPKKLLDIEKKYK
jgi:hypothetical protein